MSELITDSEDLGREFLKKIRPERGNDREFPSGLKLEDVIGWDKFLAAWHKDRAPGSLSVQYIQALKTFVLNWKITGSGGGYKVPLQVRNKATGEVMEIECETGDMPDFTYNHDGVKNIEDLFMTYQLWMDAVADLKLNLSGPSMGAGFEKYEAAVTGGVVDASSDVELPDLDGLDDIDRVLG